MNQVELNKRDPTPAALCPHHGVYVENYTRTSNKEPLPQETKETIL